MTGKKAPEASEAMIDETLAESFPASDPPAWTLGVEAHDSAVSAPKGGRYVTRDAVLKLLTDDEVARVATLEAGPELGVGEQYLDLARLELGVREVEAGRPLDMAHVLPRSAVSEETWSKLLLEARRGWQSPSSV